MAQKQYGTTALSGLNIKSGSHLIADHELVQSVNGFTDEDGVWSVAKRPERLYSGTNIVAYEAGRMGGADHHVWLDGSTLFDNGGNVGTIAGATSDMEIKAIDDQFLILGGTKNMIWDGTHLREQGAWQADFIYSINYSEDKTEAGAPNITGVTLANPCVIEMDLNAFVDGDRFFIEGIAGGGPVELNDRYFTVVTSVQGVGGTVTISDDSSGFTGPWASGGTAFPAAGLTGRYKFYYTQVIRLTDGSIIEGKPRGYMFDTDQLAGVRGRFDIGPDDQIEPTELNLVATDYVLVGVQHDVSFDGMYFFSREGVDLFDIDGVAGVDYHRGVRIYRTKANGYDVYREREYFEGDDFVSTFNDTIPSGSGTVGSGIMIERLSLGAPDDELGAVLPYSFNDHISAPPSNLATFAGQRVFLAVGKFLHWSGFDGIEYYSDAGNVLMWDTITALGTYRDYCIVFSADRMWAVRMINGVPDIEEIDTAVGTTFPKAVEQTSMGLMFLREDGLWMFAGGTTDKISRRAFKDILNPQSVILAGDILYLSGSEQAFVAINRGDAWVWHESSHFLPLASSTSGVLYAAGTFSVEQLFLGARTSGSFKTKSFGGMDLSMKYKLEMDMEGDTIPAVIINGNVVSDTDWHGDDTDYSFPGRRVIWTYTPQVLSHYFEVECDVSGDARVFGLIGSLAK